MTDSNSRADVGVLGAGIMGSCLALELAQRGYRVDLIDLAPSPMTGASLHNEGKLHLGFVYAKDPLKETHGLMVRGSIAFSHIIKKLTGRGTDEFMLSQPFHYFVPNDSQLSMSAIESHFDGVEKAIYETIQSTETAYLDSRADQYYEKNSSAHHNKMFSQSLTLGSFRTEECSVSTVAVANIITQAIKEQPRINFIGNTKVLAVSRLASGDMEVEIKQHDKVYLNRYSCAANCLWDDKLRIDKSVGIGDQGPWILRYKATINISAPKASHSEIPSATGILGAYGDIVNHNNGSYYLSWYPRCKVAESTTDDGRGLHDEVHNKTLSRNIRKAASGYPLLSKFIASIAHRKFIRDNIKEMSAYIPALDSVLNSNKKCTLGGGVILARGTTDIDDPKSNLHQRSAVGPAVYGSYVTIDTGKYCMGPLFAMEAADMIAEIL